MSAPLRWPLHPVPSEGEALSSWLTRIAAAHQIRLDDLVGQNLGDYSLDINDRASVDIDVYPPPQLLAALEERTGRTRDQIRSMSLAGLVPWLLDTLQPSDDPVSFQTYVRQHHVLLPKLVPLTRPLSKWRAWIPREPLRRACPTCVNGPDPFPGLTLVSRLPLTLSCPIHGCYLTSFYGLMDDRVFWVDDEGKPRLAPAAVRAMDGLTWDALRLGRVDLPRRRVHAGIWFRILRTLIDELSVPAKQCGSRTSTLRAVWASIEQEPRGNQNVWYPFETMAWPTQQLHLEAAASAMQMISDGTIHTAGHEGALFLPQPPQPCYDGAQFLPEPFRPVADGRTPRPTCQPVREAGEPFNYWRAAVDTVNEVIALALIDPATAEELYQILSHGPGGRETALRVLADTGITDFSSSHNPLD